MKLIINIPKENYKEMCEYGNERVDFDLKRMIQNGTPIPDNATNGDVMKLIFPKKGVTYYNASVLEQIRAEIEQNIGDNPYKNDGIYCSLHIIDKYTK